MARKKYTIRILDNFRFMDESEEYDAGTYDTYEEAVSRCRVILDEFLESAYQSGETAEQLYGTYVMFGETPMIRGPKPGSFDPNTYARGRCMEIAKLHQPRIKRAGKG